MAKTEDLLDHTGEDECPVCRAFDLAYDVVIPALAAWENHHGLKEGQLGLEWCFQVCGRDYTSHSNHVKRE